MGQKYIFSCSFFLWVSKSSNLSNKWTHATERLADFKPIEADRHLTKQCKATRRAHFNWCMVIRKSTSYDVFYTVVNIFLTQAPSLCLPSSFSEALTVRTQIPLGDQLFQMFGLLNIYTQMLQPEHRCHWFHWLHQGYQTAKSWAILAAATLSGYKWHATLLLALMLHSVDTNGSNRMCYLCKPDQCVTVGHMTNFCGIPVRV